MKPTQTAICHFCWVVSLFFSWKNWQRASGRFRSPASPYVSFVGGAKPNAAEWRRSISSSFSLRTPVVYLWRSRCGCQSRVSTHHRELHDWMPNKGPAMLIRWDPPSQGNHHTIPLGFIKASVWSELTLNEDTQTCQTTGLTMSRKSCRHQPVRYMSKQELRRLGALRQDKVQKQQLVAFLKKKVFPFFISELSIKWCN